jgi:glycosyltransferase involved in cell wall biosynthesis
MKPAVSVVLATHNYARYLSGAIESVRAQSWSDWELVIVDDGSTDDTPAIVRRFSSDPRIRYIRSDNLGQARAKSLAIALARAPLIAPLDGDDDWLPQKLERQLSLFREHPTLGVVYSRRCLIDGNGAPLPTPQTKLASGDIFTEMVLRNPICYSSSVIRREVFEHIGLFDPQLDLAVDYELWLRASRHYRFAYVDEVLVRYRTGHANLSRRLTERVTSVLSIMRRCLVRRGRASEVSRRHLRDAWGSTFRSLGYSLREKNPFCAIACYAKGCLRDGRVAATCRAAGAIMIRSLGKRLLVRA